MKHSMTKSMRRKIWSILGVSFYLLGCETENCVTPSESIAGDDLYVGGFQTTLNAEEPHAGQGQWSVISGANGQFDNRYKANSIFSGDLNSTYELLWEVKGCYSNRDTMIVHLIEDNGIPVVVSLTHPSGISGLLVKIHGINFPSSNLEVGPIVVTKMDGYSAGAQGIFPVISYSSTQVSFLLSGVNGGEAGQYALAFRKKENGIITTYPTDHVIEIEPASLQFSVSGRTSKVNLPATKGEEIGVGVLNGGITMNDYTIELVRIDNTTGQNQVVPAQITNFILNVSGGPFDGMDELKFQVPLEIPSGYYAVKVNSKSAGSLYVGWNGFLGIN
jgi:hypothetical protein